MDLKKYRRVAGISPVELSRRSGVDLAIISRLESGERNSASYENTVRLARALNLTPEELQPVDENLEDENARLMAQLIGAGQFVRALMELIPDQSDPRVVQASAWLEAAAWLEQGGQT